MEPSGPGIHRLEKMGTAKHQATVEDIPLDDLGVNVSEKAGNGATGNGIPAATILSGVSSIRLENHPQEKDGGSLKSFESTSGKGNGNTLATPDTQGRLQGITSCTGDAFADPSDPEVIGNGSITDARQVLLPN